jgi:hypothetical protein
MYKKGNSYTGIYQHIKQVDIWMHTLAMYSTTNTICWLIPLLILCELSPWDEIGGLLHFKKGQMEYNTNPEDNGISPSPSSQRITPPLLPAPAWEMGPSTSPVLAIRMSRRLCFFSELRAKALAGEVCQRLFGDAWSSIRTMRTGAGHYQPNTLEIYLDGISSSHEFNMI